MCDQGIPAILRALDREGRSLWNLPDVEKVLSLLSAPLLRSGQAPFLLTMTPTYVWGEGMEEAAAYLNQRSAKSGSRFKMFKITLDTLIWRLVWPFIK